MRGEEAGLSVENEERELGMGDRYDIVGDVHGHAGKLEALLFKMGYRERGGAWRHPEAVAVFVGDFVDRGPRQLDAVNIVRSMIDAGSGLAVMGNHELNAIGWITPSRRLGGDFLREHSGARGANNLHHHKEFLAQVGSGSALHRELVAWFMGLPLWLDLPGLRVAHACFHPRAVETIRARLGGATLDEESLHDAIDEAAAERLRDPERMTLFEAVEIVCKGVEVPLPGGACWVDSAGYSRSRVRSRWWDPSANTFRACAILPESDKAAWPDEPIPECCKVQAPLDKPLFFGHYWMSGTPRILGPRVACVDYSAAKDGPLVAYRFEGEEELDDSRFIAS